MYAPGPSADDVAAIAQQRASARSQYLNQQNQSIYDRGQSTIQHGLDQQRFGVQWGRARESLPGGFAHRGLLNSGIYQDALQNYGVDRGLAQQQMDVGYNRQLGQFDVNDQNALTTNINDNNATDLDEQRRAAIAAAIRKVVI